MADPESPSASVQKTLKSASGGSGSPGSQPKWMKRQRRLFTNFCNAKLCDRDDVPPITDVFEDLRDGRVLYALLEELSGQSLAPLGRIKKPKKGKQETRIDHVSNLSICFRYIKQTTKTVGIGPSDIADGKPTMVLGLLWSIIVFFTSKDLGGVDDISALKKKILKWCQKRTEANTDVEIRNLKDSFMDGRAAFAEARAKYGVPELLDGDDAECWKEDQAMVTYLSEMMKRLPEKVADVSEGALSHVDASFEATAATLAELAGIASAPGAADACGEKPTVLLVASSASTGPGWAGGADTRDGAVVAPGAKACKAGALAPIAAVEALLHGLSDDQRPKVNVEVVCACPAADGSFAHLRKVLADRDRAPDYVLVDEVGAGLVPGAFGAFLSCRGFLRVDVAVDAGPAGPTVFSARDVLCAALAGLRGASGALAVDGLAGFAKKNKFTEAAAADAALDPSLTAAAPLAGWTLAEHLCFHPGVSVADFAGDAAASSTSTWRRASSPQGRRGGPVPGRPLVVLGAAPSYLPLAAAVGAALPKAATYACGLHDPGAALGEATERADLADFKGSVKTLVLLLLGAAGLPKQSKAVDPAVFFGN
ncbi:hypothetical protein JL720_9684 [Aureococcus anophagefferens]|nr:hypothetical protein JL720_9684 [Aureococcus anophagefferens]